jgi:hypothetical protein
VSIAYPGYPTATSLHLGKWLVKVAHASLADKIIIINLATSLIRGPWCRNQHILIKDDASPVAVPTSLKINFSERNIV